MLGHIGPEAADAIPALIESLKDENNYVRTFAAFALGFIGPKATAAGPMLVKLVKDRDAIVRSAAAGASVMLRQMRALRFPLW